MIFLLMVYYCPPLQLLHMPYSKRAAETGRNVQITKKATQHRREKTEEGGETAAGPEL